MRCRSFLSICRKLQKSSLNAPAAKSLTNFARMSEFRDLVEKKKVIEGYSLSNLLKKEKDKMFSRQFVQLK